MPRAHKNGRLETLVTRSYALFAMLSATKLLSKFGLATQRAILPVFADCMTV